MISGVPGFPGALLARGAVDPSGFSLDERGGERLEDDGPRTTGGMRDLLPAVGLQSPAASDPRNRSRTTLSPSTTSPVSRNPYLR